MRKLTREEFEAQVLMDLWHTLLSWGGEGINHEDARGAMKELIADGWTPPRYEEGEE